MGSGWEREGDTDKETRTEWWGTRSEMEREVGDREHCVLCALPSFPAWDVSSAQETTLAISPLTEAHIH